MKNRVFESIIGMFTIIVVGYFVYVAYNIDKTSSAKNSYHIKASFQTIDGIMKGSDVMVSGIKVGEVTNADINHENYNAEITMRIDNRIKLPVDSMAMVLSVNLLGIKYISISPGGDDNFVPDGGWLKYTQSTMNIESLINKLVVQQGGMK